MTARLYHTDSYLTQFTATVVDRAEAGRRIYLSQTAFYPTSGGQPHDRGRLGGVDVVDVVDEEDRIAHLLAAPLPDGDAVAGTVDWTRRFDHMQQHTGQHLLSAVLAELVGAPTISVHFGAEASTLDLELDALRPEQAREAERRANEVITQNRPVSIAFEDAASASGLRKASARAGSLRIVTIADLDRSACGGTHVRATGEIGALLIRRVERVKKQVRLEFLCGARAIRRARADFDLLSEVAVGGSASIEEVPAIVSGLRDQLKTVQAGRKTLTEELSRYRAAGLVQETPTGVDGIKRIQVQPNGASMEELRSLAQAVITHPRTCFAGVAEPATLILATSADSGLDAGAMLREALSRVGGKGGGNARMAQGGLPPGTDASGLLRSLLVVSGS